MSQHSLSSDLVLPRVWDFLLWEHSLAWGVLSPDLIVLETSERFSEFQWDRSLEPVGRQVGELIWELVGAEAGLREVLQGSEQIFSLENINRKAQGESTIYLALHVIRLSEREPEKGLLLIIQDTTFTSTLEQELVQDRNELRLARRNLSQANEELRKLNRLKSLFLSIAAHDLRSPLTAVRGYTELAQKDLNPETQAETADYLSTAISLVDAMNRLIADFLDLDIIEQGNLKIRPVVCNLNAVVPGVAEIMSAFARRKRVRIEIKLEESLPAIYADPDRMQQILFNLLGNAIKYTGPNDQVTVETYSQNEHVLLRVTDHGPGIPEAEIPRLFDLYHRTEEARQSKTKGLGLGLFIVKSLVDLQHGQIFTRSQIGQGTEFTVRIPVYQSTDGASL